jgi:hypothetical protein
MAIFWDLAPCSLVDIKQLFIGSYCLQHPDNGESGSSDTSVSTSVYGATSQKSAVFMIPFMSAVFIEYVNMYQSICRHFNSYDRPLLRLQLT